jgi:hypothetical protein
VDAMEADGPTAVGKRTENGVEGDGRAGNRTAMSCEDEECLQPKAGAEVESEVSPTIVGGIEVPMEEAGEEAASVGKAEDAMLEGTSETIERLASTAGRMAASVAMTGGFRCCSEFDIIKSRAACANPAICILR